MSERNRTPEEVADVCERVVSREPADEQVEAYLQAFYTLTQHGLYPGAAVLCRRAPGITESDVYELLMHHARMHGHDEGLVFETVYGL